MFNLFFPFIYLEEVDNGFFPHATENGIAVYNRPITYLKFPNCLVEILLSPDELIDACRWLDAVNLTKLTPKYMGEGS